MHDQSAYNASKHSTADILLFPARAEVDSAIVAFPAAFKDLLMNFSAAGRRSLVFLVVLVGVSLCGFPAAADVSTYEKTLSDRGIAPNADGINDYLQQLHPSPELRAKALALIKQLGDDNFSRRESAMQQLLIMPVLDTEAIAAATESPDPEVRWRSQKVLGVGRPETERMQYAAVGVLEEKKLSTTLPGLI